MQATNWEILQGKMKLESHTPHLEDSLRQLANASDPIELSDVMAEILGNSAINETVKDYLAYTHRRNVLAAQLWGLERFSEYMLSMVLRICEKDMSLALALAAAKNENLRWYEVAQILGSSGLQKNQQVKAAFLESLNSKVGLEQIFNMVQYKEFLKADAEVLVVARKLYNIDDSIPDEWVNKMFGVLSPDEEE